MSVLYTNNAKTTLSASLNNSATSLSVASSSGFPSLSGSHYFYATLDDNTNLEVVKVTAVSGTTWTVVRGQDNTSATAFSSGDTVELRLNAALLTDVVNDALASSFTRQDFTGNGSTTAFTLNKTPGSENDLIVFIEGVFQNQADYTLSGTTLTFDEAPASSRKIVVYHVSASVSGDSLALNTFSGDGSTTAFTMSVDPLYENNTMVFIDGVYQNKSTYSTSGTTLTFDAAPANGTAIDVTTHTQATVNVPVDGSVSTAKLAADAVTGAKIADDAIDSEHYTDGSIDTAHIGNLQVTTGKLAADAVTAAKLADDAVVTANITDDAVTTAKVADDQITLAKLAGLARGKIIYGDASGNPAALALGSAGTVLTSDGTDISWAEEVAVNYLPLAGGTMTGNIVMADDTSIGIADDAERIEFDGAGDINILGANLGIGTTSPSTKLEVTDANGVGLRFGDIASTPSSQTAGYVGMSTSAYSGNNGDLVLIPRTSATSKILLMEGNVGIGTTSPDGILHVKPASGDTYVILEAGQSDGNAGLIYHNNSGTQVGYNLYDTDDNIYYIGVNGINRFKVQSGQHFELRGPDANSNQVKMMDSSGNIDGYIYAEASEIGFLDADGNWAMQVKTDNYVRFLVNNSEGGRFDSSGNLIVGDTAVPNGSNSCFSVSSGGTVTTSRAATNSQTHFLFMNPNGGVGSIRTNASATAFNTTSDARLKDVTGSARGLEVINALNPVAYNWKVDGKADEGLIAQEVLEVVPNAVSGSEEEYYQMDYSKLVTPLVKAIQEQQTIIEDLKARIEKLES